MGCVGDRRRTLEHAEDEQRFWETNPPIRSVSSTGKETSLRFRKVGRTRGERLVSGRTSCQMCLVLQNSGGNARTFHHLRKHRGGCCLRLSHVTSEFYLSSRVSLIVCDVKLFFVSAGFRGRANKCGWGKFASGIVILVKYLAFLRPVLPFPPPPRGDCVCLSFWDPKK